MNTKERRIKLNRTHTHLQPGPVGRSGVSSEDLMARHIERVLQFRARAAPAYQAMTYGKDPVEHAFELTRQAGVGARREVEFKAEYDAVNEKCRCRLFATDVWLE